MGTRLTLHRAAIQGVVVGACLSMFLGSTRAQVCPASEAQKLQISDAAGGDRLGDGVATCGPWALVGNPGTDNPFGFSRGSVYAYELVESQWIELSLSDQGAVIGAPLHGDQGFFSNGTAYTFNTRELSLKVEVKKLGYFQQVKFRVHPGLPGEPVLLFVRTGNSFGLMNQGLIESDCESVQSMITPNVLIGREFVFQALGRSTTGNMVLTNEWRVAFR